MIKVIHSVVAQECDYLNKITFIYTEEVQGQTLQYLSLVTCKTPEGTAPHFLAPALQDTDELLQY